MITIHFEQVNDCKQLFDQLKVYIKKYAAYGLSGVVRAVEDDTILLDYEHSYVNFYDSFHPLLTSVLTDYVIHTKEDDWLIDIIERLFYFTEEEDQQQILTIARTILEGDRAELPLIRPLLNRRGLIYDIFAKHISEETTIYFEAFLTFRLQEYGEILIDCVELAIDEYMFEQEYQNMIEDFRQYIQFNRSKYRIIHVVHDKVFSFHNEEFQRITREEILIHLQQDLVFEQDIDIEDMVISPLVSMVPVKVYVFSDRPDEGVILSIQAIFQERMRIYPLDAWTTRSKRNP